jgi:UDP-N-acetylglucosamine 4,6-dehydratase
MNVKLDEGIDTRDGGTGSFGKKFVASCCAITTRNGWWSSVAMRLKQHETRTSGFDHSSLWYFIGYVRDVERLKRALSTVTVVVYAAALKKVPACEYKPFEAIQTNVMGGRNVIDAAID